MGLVDTFSLVKLCINAGSQYGAIVVAAAAGNASDFNPKVVLAPLFGLGTSYKYIRAAQTSVELRARIATLAAFLYASAAAALTLDPATNGCSCCRHYMFSLWDFNSESCRLVNDSTIPND